MKFDNAEQIAGMAWTGSEVISTLNLEELAVSVEPNSMLGAITQSANNWVSYFQRLNADVVGFDNCYFASLADYYKAFKEIKFVLENKLPNKDNAIKFIETLQYDFSDSLQTSTRYDNVAGSNNIIITHNYNCSAEKKSSPVAPPIDARQTSFTKIASQLNGTEYLKALFDTTDSPRMMNEVFKLISDRTENDIIVDMPSSTKTICDEDRFFEFGYYGDGLFKIFLTYQGSKGRARGVRL